MEGNAIHIGDGPCLRGIEQTLPDQKDRKFSAQLIFGAVRGELEGGEGVVGDWQTVHRSRVAEFGGYAAEHST